MDLFTFGRWIYFDKVTGEILHNTGEVQHVDPEYESNRDPFSNIEKLMGRDPNSVGIIKLQPREKEQDFNEGMLVVVNPETLELIFWYPDPNNPEEPQAPQSLPLTEQVAQLKTQLAEAQAATLEMHESQLLQDAKIAEANAATLELYEIIAQGGTV